MKRSEAIQAINDVEQVLIDHTLLWGSHAVSCEDTADEGEAKADAGAALFVTLLKEIQEAASSFKEVVDYAVNEDETELFPLIQGIQADANELFPLLKGLEDTGKGLCYLENVWAIFANIRHANKFLKAYHGTGQPQKPKDSDTMAFSLPPELEATRLENCFRKRFRQD